jgi:hypothetical protein
MKLSRADKRRYRSGRFTPVEAFAVYMSWCTDRQAASIMRTPDPVAAAYAAYLAAWPKQPTEFDLAWDLAAANVRESLCTPDTR